MNRNEELKALLLDLHETPPALEYTLTRAKARRKTSIRRIFAPLGTVCGLVLVFMLMINVSPTFADACSGIPLIGELVASLKQNPSLQVAIENDYFQSIDEEQTDKGVSCRLLGIIVDRKQLNIFYTLSSRKYDSLGSDMEIYSLDGAELEGVSSGGAWMGDENGIIRKRVDFFEGTMPEGLIFRTNAVDTKSGSDTPVAEFEFALHFDPYFTAHGETLAVNREFTIDGNTLTVESIELYPTQMRINVEDDADNPDWLKGLGFTVTDEKGNEFSSVRNGISAVGDPDGEGLGAFMLDSPYFYSSGSLTLNIQSVQWLDKDGPNTYVNLEKGVAEHLPPDTEFLFAERHGTGITLNFKVKSRGGESDYNFHQVFDSHALDAGGNEYFIGSFGSTVGWTDPNTGERIENLAYFTESIGIDNYPYDEIWLEPSYSHESILPEPFSIKLK